MVLDQTPFYAESGGQVGDSGYLEAAGVRFDVRDTTKAGGARLHHGVVARGNLSVGGAVKAEVDASVRQATALNHSATHLLHAALRQVLGDHVQQKGSLVDSQRLRFDFSHFEAIKAEQLKALEDIVNAEIRRNTEVETEETDIDTAKAKGAMALFGEKYGDQVRVLSMGGDFSVELCGGTHVSRTGDIGLFKITSEGGVAAGVRRIEAVTGAAALAYLNGAEEQLKLKPPAWSRAAATTCWTSSAPCWSATARWRRSWNSSRPRLPARPATTFRRRRWKSRARRYSPRASMVWTARRCWRWSTS